MKKTIYCFLLYCTVLLPVCHLYSDIIFYGIFPVSGFLDHILILHRHLMSSGIPLTVINNIYSFSVIKAGSDQTSTAAVTINTLTQEEVDSKYSELEGVNYKVISPNAYSFDKFQLDFSADERYKLVNISLNPREVLAALENDPSAIWVLPIQVSSQTDSINANKDQLFLQLKEVIMPSIGFNNSYVNE